MKNKTTLGVGVAGLGVGERHARRIRETDGFSLIKLFDPNIEKAFKLSVELDSEICTSYKELIFDHRIDIIIVASPDHFHAEQIVSALKAGKHVFAEKPLCNTFDELKAISDEWIRNGDNLKLFSNLILREAPVYKWLKKSINEGIFGEIYSVDGDYLYGRIEKILNGWRGTGNNYSGMKGGGIHMIDLMCWLTDQRPISLNTVGNSISTRNSSVSIYDFISTSFKFKSGMVGRITANLGCVHRHQHVLRIFGTKATFILDDKGPRVHFSRDPAAHVDNLELEMLPKRKSDTIPIFLNSVRKNINLKNKTKELFNTVSILSASDIALKTGKEESIFYL